jgi:hypothetical protein
MLLQLICGIVTTVCSFTAYFMIRYMRKHGQIR